MDWKKHASSCSHIQQGYFAAVNTVRVRIRDDKGYLTIKGPSRTGGLSRYEFEKRDYTGGSTAINAFYVSQV